MISDLLKPDRSHLMIRNLDPQRGLGQGSQPGEQPHNSSFQVKTGGRASSLRVFQSGFAEALTRHVSCRSSSEPLPYPCTGADTDGAWILSKGHSSDWRERHLQPLPCSLHYRFSASLQAANPTVVVSNMQPMHLMAHTASEGLEIKTAFYNMGFH